jgi:hypothetical protein
LLRLGELKNGPPLRLCSWNLFSLSFREVRTRTPSLQYALVSDNLCHLSIHCRFVRPGTSAAISIQFLPFCFSTALTSLVSSSVNHAPVRSLVRTMLGSKAYCHLFQHCFFVRPRISAAIAFHLVTANCSAARNSLSSSFAVHLPLRSVVQSIPTSSDARLPARPAVWSTGVSHGVVGAILTCRRLTLIYKKTCMPIHAIVLRFCKAALV